MTTEEAKRFLQRRIDLIDSDYPGQTEYRDALEIAVKALEQESCEDCISREDIQDYIAKYLSQYLYNDIREAIDDIDVYIGDMPSVLPKADNRVKTELNREIKEYCEKNCIDGDIVADELSPIIDKYRGEG